MSILSTNHRLISIGESYSAGNGIDITDQVISVTGDATPYSAGENIDIQNHIISGKDWSQDITEASSNAYNETTAWVQENYANSADMTYISAVVDTKLDASAWSTVSADYATEDYVIMADNITYNRATGYVDSQQFAKESACQSAFDYLNTNKLDVSAFDLPNSAHWNEATNVVEGNSAAWFDNVGDVEVNNWVYSNSASTEDTTNVVETNSASWSNGGGIYEVVTANSASWNEVSSKVDTNEFNTISSMFSGAIDYVSANADDQEVTNLVQTNSGVWSEVTNKLDTTSFSDVSGSFLTAINIPESANWEDATTAYQTNSASYITAHQDLSNYYTKDETSGKEELAQAFADIPVGDPEVNAYVTDNSATINGTTDLVQNSSGLWNDVAVYQSNSANYLTSHQDISYKLDTSSFTAWSAAQAENDYQLSAGTGIDLVDDDINKITRIDVTGDFGNPEVESYVQSNSATIDDVNTSYQTNSSTFLTAHQSLEGLMSANLLEFNAENNISAYNGSAFEDCAPTLPMTGRDGVDVQLDNGSLILSSTLWETVTTNSAQWGQGGGGGGDAEVNNYVYNNSAAIDETVTSYEQNSASYVVENNFEYDVNDLITAYNGSAFAGQGGGGGDVPTGTMNVSGLEYNAVNEISGYNGSAIAQYGAEKQWLVHDDTLVHASNSAQYALGVNLSAVAQLLGVDETVLWSGDAAVSNCTLTEPITNFNTVKFLLYGREDANRTRMWFECETTNDTWNIQYADGTNYAYTQLVQLSSTNTTLSAIRYKELNYGAFNSTAAAITGATGTYPTIIKAVVGVNRKEKSL